MDYIYILWNSRIKQSSYTIIEITSFFRALDNVIWGPRDSLNSLDSLEFLGPQMMLEHEQKGVIGIRVK